eukprot:189972-Pyramimonas_sp.AAC.1
MHAESADPDRMHSQGLPRPDTSTSPAPADSIRPLERPHLPVHPRLVQSESFMRVGLVPTHSPPPPPQPCARAASAGCANMLRKNLDGRSRFRGQGTP